jgi:hypothetical protein
MLLKNTQDNNNFYPAAILPISAGYCIENINNQKFDQADLENREENREETGKEILDKVCPTGFFHF